MDMINMPPGFLTVNEIFHAFKLPYWNYWHVGREADVLAIIDTIKPWRYDDCNYDVKLDYDIAHLHVHVFPNGQALGSHATPRAAIRAHGTSHDTPARRPLRQTPQ
jgi:hypothetical protein